MRTTAAVTEERGAPFTIQDVDVDDPRPGEVRVELVACGVCHTDAIARDGDLPFPFPGVLGHEGVGRVEAVGDPDGRRERGERWRRCALHVGRLPGHPTILSTRSWIGNPHRSGAGRLASRWFG